MGVVLDSTEAGFINLTGVAWDDVQLLALMFGWAPEAPDLSEHIPEADADSMCSALCRTRSALAQTEDPSAIPVPAQWPALTSEPPLTGESRERFLAYAGPRPDEDECRRALICWARDDLSELLEEVIDVVGWGEFTIG